MSGQAGSRTAGVRASRCQGKQVSGQAGVRASSSRTAGVKASRCQGKQVSDKQVSGQAGVSVSR